MASDQSHPTAEFVEALYEAHGGELHSFLVNRLRRDEDAADLAQEVYVRLMRLKRTALVRNPAAYLFFVAKQVLGDFQKNAIEQRRHVMFDSELAERSDEDREPAASAEPVDLLIVEEKLRRLLGLLPAVHRDVLLLRKRDGLSWAEIAHQLGLSVHTVKKYLARAQAELIEKAPPP